MLLESPHDLDKAVFKATAYEKSGQQGFILQSMVPHSNRTLRVVVIGQAFEVYWRIQDNPDHFGNSLSSGARIDHGGASGYLSCRAPIGKTFLRTDPNKPCRPGPGFFLNPT